LNKIGSETTRITQEREKNRTKPHSTTELSNHISTTPKQRFPIQEEIQNHDTERHDLVTTEEIEITKNTCQRPPKVQREEEKSQIS
jgi:hypothetical protein